MDSSSASHGSGEQKAAADRVPNGASALFRDRYRRELLGRNVLRLGLTYLAPLILPTVYFHVQYRELSREGRLQHLSSVAEHRANALDLFLRERVVNLGNLVEDPRLSLPPSSAQLEAVLRRLRRDSETFVDVGFVDASGVLRAYAGPFPSLEQRSYGSEAWFLALEAGGERHVITDRYLGFRNRPHLTIALRHVNDLLDDLIDGFWLREMAVSNIEIVKRYAPERLELVTDGNQIKQVLLNVLNNAADAIRPPGRITITTARAAEGISVGIADTGRGIGHEEMGRIFMPFFTTKDVGKGTGLGLSVSLGIVRSLGGRILVESLPGKGSVFTVLLPTGLPEGAPGAGLGRA